MEAFNWQTQNPDFISVDNRRLECRCFGPGPAKAPADAPTIVLLHEGLGCVALWRSFPEQLAQATGCGVFAYSRFGYGASDTIDLPRPLDYMTREAVDTLPKIIDTIGAKKVILIGHSDGASIASIYAGSVADHRVRALVLMAPHFFTESISIESIREAKLAYENANLRAKLAVYHDNVDAAFIGWNDAWLNPAFLHWDISDNIDYLRVPILAIQGRQDQYGSLRHLQILEQRCYAPVEQLVIDDCRHSPHLEQTDVVLESIQGFVARLIRFEAA